MNHTKPLEKELESWIPRRPSARLKRRLFPAPVEATPKSLIPAWSQSTSGARGATRPTVEALFPAWAKFAPICCILLLAMVFCVGRREQTSYLAVTSGSNVLAGLSADLLAFCAADTLGERLNNCVMPVSKLTPVSSKPTFEWTRSGHFLSTTDSFPIWKTNLQKL